MNAFTLPVTVLIATRDEEKNLTGCLAALKPAGRAFVVDAHSAGRTASLAASMGARVVQSECRGAYPKKRQWALASLYITAEWVLLPGADELAPPLPWEEIAVAITA